MNLLKRAEECRRERPSMSTRPLSAAEHQDVIARLVDGGLLDFASAGHKIAEGQQHLDESLPNGQKLRSELAFAAIKQGVLEMELWMRARGYDV